MSDKPTILLVDDQDRNLDALEVILEPAGYALVRARSAEEALLVLLKGEFAAIICDIRMPGIGGIELARMIKQRRRTQYIPILFLTAHTVEEADVLRGYGVGAVDYLSKPINPDILRSKVAVFAELYRATRALAEANKALADEVGEKQRAQEALRQAKDELEHRVEERTAELIAANRALRESEERMSLAMQGAAMGVYSHDLRTGQMQMSKALEMTFGLAAGDFDGTFDAFLNRVHSDDRQRVRETLDAAGGASGTFSIEYRFRRNGDSAEAPDRWMSATGSFVLDEENHPIHGVGVCTDVTAQRLAADELRALKEAAETANRAKDHFLAVLSHELRTPLTPVLASVQELLRTESLEPELRESLDLVNRNVELEARLIDDLLDLTRIARGKMELQRSVVNLAQVLEHALRTCEADFQGKGIEVRIRLEATKRLVLGDRARMLQVFWNLLKNAAKFTPGGGRVEVKMLDTDHGRVRVEVRDSGVGIEPPRLNSIFDAFVQGGDEVTRRFGGLGLGLSICKALVELHGGAVSAASAGLGKGAIFAVELPLAASQEQTIETHPVPAHAPPKRPTTNLRLLLVEDHADTSRVMQRLLARCGYEVTAADGVSSALRAAAAAPQPFDVVVSDIGLPDGSGLDLIRQLRIQFPAMPSVAISGFGMDEDHRRSREAGFSAHLTKPIDLTVLRTTIERLASQDCATPAISL